MRQDRVDWAKIAVEAIAQSSRINSYAGGKAQPQIAEPSGPHYIVPDETTVDRNSRLCLVYPKATGGSLAASFATNFVARKVSILSTGLSVVNAASPEGLFARKGIWA